jgi:hypothetical protein
MSKSPFSDRKPDYVSADLVKCWFLEPKIFFEFPDDKRQLLLEKDSSGTRTTDLQTYLFAVIQGRGTNKMNKFPFPDRTPDYISDSGIKVWFIGFKIYCEYRNGHRLLLEKVSNGTYTTDFQIGLFSVIWV